jgi:hypothetical protein
MVKGELINVIAGSYSFNGGREVMKTNMLIYTEKLLELYLI